MGGTADNTGYGEAVSIALSPEEVLQAQQFAAEAEFGAGPYGRVARGRLLTGRIGELAAVRWLERRLDRRVARMYWDRGPDLSVNTYNLEVKSFRTRSWAEYGPTISAYQAEKIAASSDYIVFMIVLDESDTEACVAGWMPAEEPLANGRAFVTDDLRAQIQLDLAQLQMPEGLLQRLQVHRTFSPHGLVVRASDCSQCGRPRQLGHCWWCCTWPEKHPASVWVTEHGRRFHVAPRSWLASIHPDWKRGSGNAVPTADIVAQRPPCYLCLDLAGPGGATDFDLG